MKKLKIAIFTEHPTQWESPFFSYLTKLSDFDLEVFYTNRLGVDESMDKESKLRIIFDIPDILDGYKYNFFSTKKEFLLRMTRNHYDVLIVEGHSGLVQRLAILFGIFKRTPMIYRADSTLLYKENVLKKVLRKIFLPVFFKSFAAFLPLSSATVDFLKFYKVPTRSIFLSPYVINNQWYSELSFEWRTREYQIKEQLELDKNKSIVLAVLRFEERENPLEFLSAAEYLLSEMPSVTFVLVGDGLLKNKVVQYIKNKNLSNVILPGYVKLSELTKYFAVADVFVHPAKEECWGLSVNEAMASGVPVVISDNVGCHRDLIPSEETGFVYSSGVVTELVDNIKTLLLNREKKEQVVKAARIRLQNFGYESAAKVFEEAIRFSLNR